MEEFNILDIRKMKKLILLIYMHPTKVAERSTCFDVISEKIPRSNNLMILGNFNNTLGEIDRCGKTVHMYDNSY